MKLRPVALVVVSILLLASFVALPNSAQNPVAVGGVPDAADSKARGPARPAAPFDAFLPLNSEFEYEIEEGGQQPVLTSYAPLDGSWPVVANGTELALTASPWKIRSPAGAGIEARVGNFDPRDPDSEVRTMASFGGRDLYQALAPRSGVTSLAFQILDAGQMTTPNDVRAFLVFDATGDIHAETDSAELRLDNAVAASVDAMSGHYVFSLRQALADNDLFITIHDPEGATLNPGGEWPDELGDDAFALVQQWTLIEIRFDVGYHAYDAILDDVRIGYDDAFENADFSDFTAMTEVEGCDATGPILDAGDDVRATAFPPWGLTDPDPEATLCLLAQGTDDLRLRIHDADAQTGNAYAFYPWYGEVATSMGQGARILAESTVIDGASLARLVARADNGNLYTFEVDVDSGTLQLPIDAAHVVRVAAGTGRVLCDETCAPQMSQLLPTGSRLVPIEFSFQGGTFDLAVDDFATEGFYRGHQADALTSFGAYDYRPQFSFTPPLATIDGTEVLRFGRDGQLEVRVALYDAMGRPKEFMPGPSPRAQLWINTLDARDLLDALPPPPPACADGQTPADDPCLPLDVAALASCLQAAGPDPAAVDCALDLLPSAGCGQEVGPPTEACDLAGDLAQVVSCIQGVGPDPAAADCVLDRLPAAGCGQDVAPPTEACELADALALLAACIQAAGADPAAADCVLRLLPGAGCGEEIGPPTEACDLADNLALLAACIQAAGADPVAAGECVGIGPAPPPPSTTAAAPADEYEVRRVSWDYPGTVTLGPEGYENVATFTVPYRDLALPGQDSTLYEIHVQSPNEPFQRDEEPVDAHPFPYAFGYYQSQQTLEGDAAPAGDLADAAFTPVRLLLDTVAPSLDDATDLAQVPTTGDPYTFTLKAVDGMGVARAYLEWELADDEEVHEDTLFDELTQTADPDLWSVTFDLPPEAGHIHYHFHAIDHADNIAGTDEIDLDAVDDDAPRLVTQVVDRIPGDAYLSGGDASLVATVTDNRGLHTVRAVQDAQTIGEETGDAATAGTYTFPLPNGLADGATTTLSATAIDLSDNEADSLPLTLTIDRTPPTTTLVDPPSEWVTSPTLTLDLDADDATSGVALTRVAASRTGAFDFQDGSSLELAGDGDWLIHYYSIDNAGNREDVHEANVRIDSGLPTIDRSLTGVAGDNGWKRGPVTVTVLAQDETSGIAALEHRLDLGAWKPYEGPIVVSSPGTHRVDYRATDEAGHQSTAFDEFKVDGADPELVAQVGDTVIEDATWFSGDVSVILDATDDASGVTLEWALDDDAPQPYAGPINVSGEGSHSLAYTLRDGAGRLRDGVVFVRIDATPPTGTVTPTGLMRAGWFVEPVDLVFSVTDGASPASGVHRTEVRIDGGAWIPWTPLDRFTQAGEHAIQWAARDQAGNSVTGSFPIKVDLTPPVSSHDAPLSWSKTSPLTVTFTRTDDASGAAATYLKAWPAGSAEPDYGAATQAVLTSDGAWNIRYYSVDAAGNQETPRLVVARVDSTPPTVDIDVEGTQGLSDWYTTPAIVTVTADDATSRIQSTFYDIDDGPRRVYSGSTPVRVAELGAHTFTVRATDQAGHTTVKSIPLKVDTVAPTLSHNAPATWVKTADHVAVTLAAVDSASGALEVRHKLWTGDVEPATYATGSPVHVAGQGAWNLKAYAVDAAGLASVPTTVPVLIDNVAPATLTDAPPAWSTSSPVSVHVLGTDATSGVTETYAKWWKEGAAIPTQFTPFEEAIVFALEGVHQLRYYSVDQAGNVESVQSATVKIDTAPPTLTWTQKPTQVVRGTPIAIRVTAVDNIAVTSAKVFIEGAGNHSMTKSGNDYNATIPTTSTTPAFLNYTVEVKDAAGQTASAERVSLRVQSGPGSKIAITPASVNQSADASKSVTYGADVKDAQGNPVKADPAVDLEWSLSDPAAGTFAKNVLTPNGKAGTFTVTAVLKSDPFVRELSAFTMKPGPAARLQITNGDVAQTVAGTPVTYGATLRDAQNNALPADAAKDIEWSLDDAQAGAFTQNVLKGGIKAGVYSVQAVAKAAPHVVATSKYTLRPGAATTLAITAANLTQAAGAQSPVELAVEGRDKYGNAFPLSATNDVVWSIPAAGGRIQAAVLTPVGQPGSYPVTAALKSDATINATATLAIIGVTSSAAAQPRDDLHFRFLLPPGTSTAALELVDASGAVVETLPLTRVEDPATGIVEWVYDGEAKSEGSMTARVAYTEADGSAHTLAVGAVSLGSSGFNMGWALAVVGGFLLVAGAVVFGLRRRAA